MEFTSKFNKEQQSTQGQEKQQEKQKTKDKDAVKTFIDPLNAPFPGLITTAYTDTDEMITMFNNFLAPLSPDFYGCKIEVNENKQMFVYLCFTDSDTPVNDKYQFKAMEQIVDKNKINNSIDARIDYYNNTFANNNGIRNQIYKLTDKAKEVLKELMPPYAFYNGNQVNWKEYSCEIALNTFGKSVIGYQVVVDFNKLLKKVYGDLCEDGGRWNYLVLIGNPINPVRTFTGNLISNKWQLFILRLKDKDVYDVATQYGYQQFGGNKMGFVPARR